MKNLVTMSRTMKLIKKVTTYMSESIKIVGVILYMQFKLFFVEKILKMEEAKSMKPTNGLPTTRAHFLQLQQLISLTIKKLTLQG